MPAETLSLSTALLTNPRFGPEMVRRGAERLFDYYFLLLRRLHEHWNDAGLVSEPTEYFRAALWSKQDAPAVLINRFNHQLAKEYELVDYQPSRGHKPVVKLLDPRDLSFPYRYPVERYFKIPLRFWTDRWAGNLSLKAKFLYMVALYEQGLNTPKAEEAGKPLEWFRSIRDMSVLYHIGTSTISTAQKELSVAGLLQVTPSGHWEGMANRYKTVDVNLATAGRDRLKALEGEWGPDRYAQVIALARKLDAQNHPEAIGLLADLLDLYPQDEVEAVVDSVASKSRQNPRRTAKYVAGILSHRQHDPVREIRLLGTVAAGTPVFAQEQADEMVSVRVKPTAPKDLFALKINGDSMIGAGIRNGDYLVVARAQDAQDGQIVVVLHNGESTVKRYMNRNGHIFLKPENPDYTEIPIQEGDEFQIQGYVVGTSSALGQQQW